MKEDVMMIIIHNCFIIIWFFILYYDLHSFVFVSVFSPSDKEGMVGKR